MTTLLEKAKMRVTVRRKRIRSQEEVELALAWAREEVNIPQVALAMGTSNGGVYLSLATSLAQYIREQEAKKS